MEVGSRRQFLAVLGAAVGLAPAIAYLGSEVGAPTHGDGRVAFPIIRSDDEWRALLAPAAYKVLRQGNTGWAFSSPLDHESRPGRYRCAGCARHVFSSDAKYDSGTGWPSFSAPVAGAVGTCVDRSMFMVRTEVHCADCGGHLGHLFPDGPRPTGLRYCMNGVALTFEPLRS